MLTWNVTYHCKPGQREAFYQVLQDLGVRSHSIQETGCRQYDYFFSAQDPDVLLLVESWDAPEDQEAHCKTEVFAALMASKPQYVAETTTEKFTF